MGNGEWVTGNQERSESDRLCDPSPPDENTVTTEAARVLEIMGLTRSKRRLQSVEQAIEQRGRMDPVLVATETMRWLEEESPPDFRVKDLLALWVRKMAKYDEEKWAQFLRPSERAESDVGAWDAPEVAELPPCNTQLWAELRIALVDKLRGSYPMYFGGVADQMRGEVLVLTFPGDYERDMVASRYAAVMEQCAAECGMADLQVEYAVLGEEARAVG